MSEQQLRSVQRLEDEIAELEKAGTVEELDEEEEEEVEEEKEEEVAEEPSEPLSKEEESFKKRYSDLRRHNQKVVDELKEAQSTLANSKRQSVGLPTAEEAEEWMKSNPKAAAIIRSIALNETSSGTTEISAIKEKLNRAEQEARILKVHPDFEEITAQNEFHNWAEEQPESVQKLIFSTAADDVIWSLKQYKKDIAKVPDAKKEAARAVSSKASKAAPGDEGRGHFTESQVAKMSMSEYEQHEDAIQKAIQSGTFVYDRSGAAR